MDEKEKPKPTGVGPKVMPAASGHYDMLAPGAQLTVISYPENLLRTAKRLMEEGQFSIAVVVAHMACEIAVEYALGEAFKARKIGDLEQAVQAFLSGYNLANEKIRDLYLAMTGDKLQEEEFWQSFVESAKRRNCIVHGGLIASKSDAEKSLEATSKLVAHLTKRKK